MATHSSVLAWRILGTGKPGGLLSMVGHTESDTTERALVYMVQHFIHVPFRNSNIITNGGKEKQNKGELVNIKKYIKLSPCSGSSLY